jgi:hypothetical protein
MQNSKNLQIGDMVSHERGGLGKVRDVNYTTDPSYYVKLGYSEDEAYEICDEVEVEWFGKEATMRAARTSVKYLTKIEDETAK